jgi:DNA-binding transcriptional ArsR family regulator
MEKPEWLKEREGVPDWVKEQVRSGPTDSESIYRVLESTRQPVMSASQIAEVLGVTKQTVYNHLDPVIERSDIHSLDVGGTTAYYQARPWDPEDVHSRPFNKIGIADVHPGTRTLVHHRAEFLRAKSQAEELAKEQGDDIGLRYDFWESLSAYIRCSTVLSAFELNRYIDHVMDFEESPPAEIEDENLDLEGFGNPGDQEPPRAPPSPGGSDLSSEQMEEYRSGTLMFSTDWFGEVEGLGGLYHFDFAVRSEVNDLLDEHPIEEGDGQDAARSHATDELYPSMNDLLAAAERADSIITEVMGEDW